MGASPYWYIVPKEDPKTALEELRRREFKAGRYYPAVERPRFPVTEKSPTPGAQHKSIAEAIRESEPEGTKSILDICRISDSPEFLAACPLSREQLLNFFGTEQPTRQDFGGMAKLKLFSDIKRGHAVFFPLYHDAKVVELLFAGYSCD